MDWWMSCGSEIQLWGKTVKIYCWPAIWKQLASDKSYGQGSGICCIPSSKCSNSLDTWCKEPTHWKRPWCQERLKAGGEGDFRGRDGWMASLTQRTWVWTNSRRWWRTWNSGVLQSMRSQSQTGLKRQEQEEKLKAPSTVHPKYAHLPFCLPWVNTEFH